jgi:hypothetical protein
MTSLPAGTATGAPPPSLEAAVVVIVGVLLLKPAEETSGTANVVATGKLQSTKL